MKSFFYLFYEYIILINEKDTVESPYSRAHGDFTRDYNESCDYAENSHYGLNRQGVR